MRRLILFDIDGTLLWSDGAGRVAIRAALVAELGTAGPIDGFRFDGKTDPQIIQELLRLERHPAASSHDHVETVCRRYAALLEAELRRGTRRMEIFPGVLALLDALEAREDALVGLLTGNIIEGARLKLRAAGIDPDRFRVGAYGSDAAERSRLPAIAAERAAPLMGRTPTGREIVIVGDTPADMTCGREVGARAIGVATGAFSVTELEAAGAATAFESFADWAAALAVLVA